MSVIAGWYPDPAGSGRSRWWDGAQWTENFETPYSLAPAQHTAPAGTPAYNGWIWAIVALLFLQNLTSLVLFIPGYFEDAAAGSSSGRFAVVDLVTTVISWIVYGVSVALAYFDWRTLRDSGVPQPFHWAFAFILPVYLIGRGIVTRRRTGRGIATVWITVVYLALGLAAFVATFSAAIQYVVNNPV